MNPKALVKVSNTIGVISIILLIYWVFVFMTVEVFELKVFRENITETFYLSILGILALMIGALIINIMFNLSRIAQRHNADHDLLKNKKSRIGIVLLIISFPIIFGILFGGDYLTSKKKEKLLIQAAESIINDYSIKVNKLANYSFTKSWIVETTDIIGILSSTDKNFPHISVIVKDSIAESKFFLGFNSYFGYNYNNDTIIPKKKNCILETTKPERDYLNRVFSTNSSEIRFSAYDGNYELYYPYQKGDNVIVLYFSDYKRYGKIGR
jgi:hypothetical protein